MRKMQATKPYDFWILKVRVIRNYHFNSLTLEIIR